MADYQVRELARRLRKLEQAHLRTKQANLGYSSIVDGAITSVDQDDDLKMVIGTQHDNTQTAAVLVGPTPPTPEAPLVTEALGGLRIYWDGTFFDGDVAPMDWVRVNVHAEPMATFEDYDPIDQTHIVGSFTSATGGELFISLPYEEHIVYLVAWTEAGKFSEASIAAFGTPTSPDVSVTEEPANSPAITLTGVPGAIVARSETVAPSTLIQYHVWTSETGDDTYVPTVDDPATLFGVPTRSAVQVIDSLPDGTPLVEDSLYYAATIATNVIGAADPSAVATGQVDMDAIRSLVLAELAFGFAVGERIEVGSSYWDADEGLVFLDSSGIPFITLPVDGETAATIAAFIVAKGLTVEGNANFYGLTQMLGTMRLLSGIPNPTLAPTLSQTWESLQTEMGPQTEEDLDLRPYMYGLCQNLAHPNEMLATISFFGGTVRSFSKTTGDVNPYIFPSLGAQWDPKGGITAIGSNYYMLGQDHNRGSAWYVYKYDLSFTKVNEFAWSTPGGATGRPAIGTDGTDVWIVYSNGSNDSRRDVYTTAGALLGRTTLIADTGPRNFAGIASGNLDFGANHTVVFVQNLDPWVFDSAYTRDTSKEFPRAGGAQHKGAWWDGTRFVGFDTSGRLWNYATGNITETEVFGGYTWDDEDTSSGSTRHETAISPATSFTWSGRSLLTVVGQPAPDADVTNPALLDKANLLRIYVGASDTTMRLQDGGGTNDALPLGVTSLTIEELDVASAVAPTSSTFDASSGAPGRLESAGEDGLGPLIDLDGTGAWRLGDASGDITGAVTVDGDLTITGAVLTGDRVNAVRITNTANQNIPTSFTQVTLDELAFDLGGTALTPDTANSRITVNEDGLYMVEALIYWANGNAGRRAVRITSDMAGFGVLTTSETAAVASSPSNFPISTTVSLTAGTHIEVLALQAGQTNLALANTFVASYLAAIKIA